MERPEWFSARTAFRYAFAAALLIAFAVFAKRIDAEGTAPNIAWCDREGTSCSDVCRDKPLTITYFYAQWCPACRKMRDITFANPEVREKLASYGTVRVDVERNPAYTSETRIAAIPAIVVTKGCTEIIRVKGFMDPGTFLGFLDGVEKIAAEH
jgi:thiol-disulfide isomerase/thioredoxin